MIKAIPAPIKKTFRNAATPQTPEECLWRERAARMTLDALGYTNLTVKPHEHNAAVRYARRWFKGLFMEGPEPDDPFGTFESAGVSFGVVRTMVLGTEPLLKPEKDDDDDEDE
jgi:hypothetical protein